jgi:hypothetical protein
MKVERVFINQEKLTKALCGEGQLNHPVGYAYCAEEDDVSCSVFLGTDRKTGEISLTKGGDLMLNVKTQSARKKGDHVADAPEVAAEAQADADAPEAEAPPL